MSALQETQRAADGAFFEDWSGWTNLGGPAQWHRYPVGHRRSNMPRYHCTLHRRWRGGPAFEVAIPENIRIVRLLQSIPCADQLPRRGVRSGPVEIWRVPADQWRALRDVLPQIVAVIGARS